MDDVAVLACEQGSCSPRVFRRVVLAVMSAFLIVIGGMGPAAGEPLDDRNKYQKFYDHCVDHEFLTEEGTMARDFAEWTGRVGEFFHKAWCAEEGTRAHPGDAVATGVAAAASAFWGDPVGDFTKAVLEGNTQAMQLVMTFWMDFKILSPSVLSANVTGVKNIVWGIAGFALIASFLVGGARLVAARRSGLQDGVEEIGMNVGRWLIFSLCIPVIVPGALIASDELAADIMNRFGATNPEIFISMTAFEEAEVGPIVMLVLAIIAIAGSFMQIMACVVRVLVLPIAAGLAPLFAALSFTETGRNGLHHLVGYMIAAVAFKPVCALLYAVVLWNVSRPGSGDDFIGAFMNALMMALAGLIAPSLVRMVAPMVSQAGGMGGGALLANVGGATGATISAIGAASAGKAHANNRSNSNSGNNNAGNANSGSSGQVGASTSAGGGGRSGGRSGSSGGSGGSGGGSGSSGGSGGSGGSSGGRSGSVSTKSVPSGSHSSGGRRSGGSGGASRRRPSRFKRPAPTSAPAGVQGRGHDSMPPRGEHSGGKSQSSSSQGPSRSRQLGGVIANTGGAFRTLEESFEGSLGYPGQIHR